MQTEIFIAVMFLLQKQNKKQHRLFDDIIQKLTPSNHRVFKKIHPETMTVFKNSPQTPLHFSKILLASII